MSPRSTAHIASPCVQVCMIDRTTGLCMGCFRTGEEISNWSIMAPETRTEIMTALPMRRALLGPEMFGEA